MKYAIYAFIVSAVVTIALGPVIIPMLRRLKFGQNERSDVLMVIVQISKIYGIITHYIEE